VAADCANRLLRRPERDPGGLDQRKGGVDCRRPARAGGSTTRTRWAILVTPNASLARAVADEVERRMPAEGPARAAIDRNGAIVVTKTMDEAIALSERWPRSTWSATLRRSRRGSRARARCLSDIKAPRPWATTSPGSNHVLPTSAAARGRGGLSAADFVRVTTTQRLSRAGLKAVAPHAIALATAEGLQGHAASNPNPWSGLRRCLVNGLLPSRERAAASEPAKRSARARVGESEGQTPPVDINEIAPNENTRRLLAGPCSKPFTGSADPTSGSIRITRRRRRASPPASACRRSPATDQWARRRDPGRRGSRLPRPLGRHNREAVSVAPAFDEYEDLHHRGRADSWSRCRSAMISSIRPTRSSPGSLRAHGLST